MNPRVRPSEASPLALPARPAGLTRILLLFSPSTYRAAWALSAPSFHFMKTLKGFSWKATCTPALALVAREEGS